MSFISDSNEIARQLKQKRLKKNPARGTRVRIKAPDGVVMLTTEQAAKVLNREPQTLRIWACRGGPIEPVRMGGPLGWRISDLEALLNGDVA